MSFGKAMHRILAASLLTLLPVAITAQGVPTIDVTSIVRLQEMISEAKLQLKEQVAQNVKLDAQTLKLIEQIQLLHSQIAALKDGLSLAELGFDKESFLKEIMPGFSDLTASLDAAKSGNWSSVLSEGSTLGGGTVSSHVDKAFASAGVERARVDQLAESEDAPAARIGTAANVNAFLSVAAESSSQGARDSLTRIDGLVGKIEDTENLKQAIDLNTRVTAELGIALANVWAMQAVQTVGMGEAGIIDAATAADEEKYLSIKLEN
ncbi:type IV secretion system protein [Paracoccus litorisediminis]|uniref:Type IV secretion system protein VirB5 n=1 Tax=Paracoccus litorisediminis TaxID=2006130 RepID=A0A844HRK1_9RHOB|nr:type IV secretion system protein [Paracoccus litorisediminis]MTH62466.1 hypothetical protein [Paracoccus litorisediminis]